MTSRNQAPTKLNGLFLALGLVLYFGSFFVEGRVGSAFCATVSMFLVIVTTVFLLANAGLLGVRWKDLTELERAKNENVNKESE